MKSVDDRPGSAVPVVLLVVSVLVGCLAGREELGAQANRGQIAFVNHTSMTLRFLVDDKEVCPAPVMKNLTCTHQAAPAKEYVLTAKGGKDFERTQKIYLDTGKVCTWTVSEDSSKTTTEGCKK